MTDVRQSVETASQADDADVIRLDLDRAVDMFETPTVHLGSSHGTFQPGIDLCVAGLETLRDARITLVPRPIDDTDEAGQANMSPP
jgi:hypothetical protein